MSILPHSCKHYNSMSAELMQKPLQTCCALSLLDYFDSGCSSVIHFFCFSRTIPWAKPYYPVINYGTYRVVLHSHIPATELLQITMASSGNHALFPCCRVILFWTASQSIYFFGSLDGVLISIVNDDFILCNSQYGSIQILVPRNQSGDSILTQQPQVQGRNI